MDLTPTQFEIRLTEFCKQDLPSNFAVEHDVKDIGGEVEMKDRLIQKLKGRLGVSDILCGEAKNWKREDIDTLGELNALVSDGDLVRVEELADALVALNLKKRNFQFFFSGHSDDHENYNHYHDRDMFVLRGKINSLTHDFTNQLSGVTYKSRLDVSSSWASHTTLTNLQT